jgi:5-methylcytosine-specific restriction endonuclease McrA
MTGKSHSSEAKVKMSKAGRGRNKRAHLSEWDGSHTAKSKLFYNSKTWQEIRTQVFERDDYTCQLTGKRGGDLECHHIMPRSKLVEDKWTDQTNLITLSKEAHRLSKGKEELLEKVLLDNLRSRGII